jgi:hypothetical protein
MNNVHSLYPDKLESYDVLGNKYTLYLQGLLPSGITTLGELPNLVIHDRVSQFYFFLRVDWDDMKKTRESFADKSPK